MVLSCGIIPVHREGKSWRYLLLRAFKYWDFPKGLREEGESPEAAARRELREETAIAEVELGQLKDFFETKPYAKGKVARYYLGFVSRTEVLLEKNPQHGRVEHHEFRWMSYEEAQALVVPRVREALDWAEARLRSL